MPDWVYLNQEFVPSEEAKISIFDHGFLYGDGLFETMRSYNGKVFLLKEHLDRLERSAEAVGLSLPFSREEITAVLNKLTELNGPNLYIRLTVTRGPGPVGIDPRLCPKPTVVVTSKDIAYNEKIYQEGTKAIFVKTIRNLAGATMPEVKSLNFLNNILAKQEVIAAGADEGFMTNYLGQVAEGTVSNVFMVRDGMLWTPDPQSGILIGVTRNKVIQMARDLGVEVKEEFLHKLDFDNASEVFYTNSGSEIVPVTELDNKPVGNGQPGPITRLLLHNYRNQAWA